LRIVVPYYANFAIARQHWLCERASVVCCRVQLKCDGTRWCRGREVKGKQANGVGSLYSFTLPRNMVYPALLPTVKHDKLPSSRVSRELSSKIWQFQHHSFHITLNLMLTQGIHLFPVLWYDMKWYDTIRYDMIWYDTIPHDMIRYDTIWYDMIGYNTIWYDVIYDMIRYDIWYDTIWYDTIWYDMIRYDTIWYDTI